MEKSIKQTPTDSYPNMVTITRGNLKGKRYINKEKAVQAILENQQQKVVQRLQKSVNKDLDKVVVNSYFEYL